MLKQPSWNFVQVLTQVISRGICGRQIDTGTCFSRGTSFHKRFLIIPQSLPTPSQILRHAVSLNITHGNSRCVHSGTHFPCLSYHGNLTFYISYVKHLFWRSFMLFVVHYRALICVGFMTICLQCTQKINIPKCRSIKTSNFPRLWPNDTCFVLIIWNVQNIWIGCRGFWHDTLRWVVNCVTAANRFRVQGDCGGYGTYFTNQFNDVTFQNAIGECREIKLIP
jgi:hypothetical protein